MDESKKAFRLLLLTCLLLINYLLLASYFKIWPFEARQLSTKTAQSAYFLYLPAYVSHVPFEIKGNSSAAIQGTEDRFVVIKGEVANHDSAAVGQVVIQADLFDRKGQLLASLQGEPLSKIVPAEANACFQLQLPRPPGYHSYKLSLENYTTIPDVPDPLEAYITRGSFDGAAGNYLINGVAVVPENGQNSEALLFTTLYDAEGRVVGCEESALKMNETPTGQPVVFSFRFNGAHLKAVESFQTQAFPAP